jgi:hypothetical protein
VGNVHAKCECCTTLTNCGDALINLSVALRATRLRHAEHQTNSGGAAEAEYATQYEPLVKGHDSLAGSVLRDRETLSRDGRVRHGAELVSGYGGAFF